MAESKRNRTWTLYFLCVALFHWHPTMTGAQDCIPTIGYEFSFNETDLPGLKLMDIKTTATEEWSFRIISPSSTLAPYFRLSGRDATTNLVSLILSRTFDLEEVKDLVVKNGELMNAILFELTCKSDTMQADVTFQRYISVLSVNEFAPTFVNVPAGGFDVSEATPLNEPMLVLENYVEDRDLNPNPPGFDFKLVAMPDQERDGISKFAIGDILTGSLIITDALDYESMDPAEAYYLLKVSVSDRQGMTSTGTIRINVIDADDQSPEFWYPGCPSPCFSAYSAAIDANFQGDITWMKPAAIGARDLDTMNSPVKYHFKQGDPDYFLDYLSIDEATGLISVTKPVAETDAAAFFVILQAVEDTQLKRTEQTTLMITVNGRNYTSPTQPTVIADSYGRGEDRYRLATIVLGCLFGLVLLILVLFVICSVAISSNGIPSMPVLPRAIGKLSSMDRITRGEMTTSRSSSPVIISSSEDAENPEHSTPRKMSSDSGVGILRSVANPVEAVPPPRPAVARTTSGSSSAAMSEPSPSSTQVHHSFFPTSPFRPDSSFAERDLDLDLLAETNEIDLHNRKGTGDRRSRLSMISGSELVPYEERLHLVGSEEGMDGVSPASSYGGEATGTGGTQVKAGVSNPAFIDDGDMMEVKSSASQSDIDFDVVPVQEARIMI